MFDERASRTFASISFVFFKLYQGKKNMFFPFETQTWPLHQALHITDSHWI